MILDLINTYFTIILSIVGFVGYVLTFLLDERREHHYIMDGIVLFSFIWMIGIALRG